MREESKLTWCIKWAATLFIILGVVFRAAGPQYQLYDIVAGLIGTILWTYVGLAWRDRAIIILNSVMNVILLIGLLKAIA